jgi:threonine/homoserine/homoserine lactone efflux protein
LVLGLAFNLGGLLVNGAVALTAAGAAARLARSDRFSKGLGRVSGAIFALLAVRLAVMERG